MNLPPALSRILTLAPLPETPTPITDGWGAGLLPIQRDMLRTLERSREFEGLGGWFEVGAGFGKTVPSLLAGVVLGAKRIALIVPATLVNKTLRAFDAWGARFSGFDPRVITVLSASRLSTAKSADVLYKIAPDLIVVDEAHTLMGQASARALRALAYLNDFPRTRVVFLSGTMGGKSVERTATWLHVCLRESSPAPVPSEKGLAARWGSVIDKGTEPASADVEYLRPLCDWAGTPRNQDGVREAWRQRRTSAPGVVATGEAGIPTALELRRWRAPEAPPPALREALLALSERWELPDGTELVEALQFQRYAATLSVGFWYRTTYHPAPAADRPVAEDVWKALRTAWARELRREILYVRTPGMDSPGRIVAALKEGHGRRALRTAWADWENVKRSLVAEKEAVWLWDGVVRGAVEWLNAQARGVVWIASDAMEAALRAAGVQTFGAGTQEPPARTARWAAKIQSHGTGKELQAWDTALILEVPTSADVWEQLLARHHRLGQPSDTVSYEIDSTLWPNRARLLSAMKSAAHQEQVALQPQRVLYATWR